MTVQEFRTIIHGATDRDQLRLMEAVIEKQLADGCALLFRAQSLHRTHRRGVPRGDVTRNER
jgi:hypothetical protein